MVTRTTSLEPEEKKEDGKVKWILDIAPGEKTACIFEFQIEYPKDTSVAGL